MHKYQNIFETVCGNRSFLSENWLIRVIDLNERCFWNGKWDNFEYALLFFFSKLSHDRPIGTDPRKSALHSRSKMFRLTHNS